MNSDYDFVILDEVNTAVHLNIIDVNRFKQILKERKDNIEVILTGRERINELIEISDYITEVKKEKHPFDKGITARKGVEY